MRIKCEVCGFIANDGIFLYATVNEDNTGKGLHEEQKYKCPSCGEISEDIDCDESTLIVYDSYTEITRTEAEEYLWMKNRHNVCQTAIDNKLLNGFIGYRNMTVEQLQELMPDGDYSTVVLSNEEYKSKYGE